MNIVHIAPFAPNRCGLYEHARDMVQADIIQGHEVKFVDAGVHEADGYKEGSHDKSDNRGTFNLITSDTNAINEADILIMHTGINDNLVVKTDAPMIWVLHGRPLACFRPENLGKGSSYSLAKEVSNWKRTKRILYFWDDFKTDWEILVPKEKHVITNPVVDCNYYHPTGNSYNIINKGDINILICDSIREDICLYETVINCIDLVKRRTENIKIHFFGLDFPLTNSWNLILSKLKEIGGLGDLYGRITCMNEIYKSMDLLISPNRILTRTIIEAYASGLPIICQNGFNNFYDNMYCCDMALVGDLYKCIYDNMLFENVKNIDKEYLNTQADKYFGLKQYGQTLTEVYNEVVK